MTEPRFVSVARALEGGLSERQKQHLRELNPRMAALMKYMRQDACEAIENGSWTRARNLVNELEQTMEVWMAVDEIVDLLVPELLVPEASE